MAYRPAQTQERPARSETRPDGSIVEYDARNRVIQIHPPAAVQGRTRGTEAKAFTDAYKTAAAPTPAPAAPSTPAQIAQSRVAGQADIEARANERTGGQAPAPAPLSIDGSISGNPISRASTVQDPNSDYGTGIRSDRPGVTPAGLPAGYSVEAAADTLLKAPQIRAENVARSKADGTFDAKVKQFNTANAGVRRMDLDGNIVDATTPATPAASAAPKPYELTYQKGNGQFYGETKDGKGQEFATQAEATAFSNGTAPSPAPAAPLAPAAPEPRPDHQFSMAPGLTPGAPRRNPAMANDLSPADIAAAQAASASAIGQPAPVSIDTPVARPVPAPSPASLVKSGLEPNPQKPGDYRYTGGLASTVDRNTKGALWNNMQPGGFKGDKGGAYTPRSGGIGTQGQPLISAPPVDPYTERNATRRTPVHAAPVFSIDPPQIDAGPQPGLATDEPDIMSADLPRLRRPAGIRRPMATVALT